jgi:transcriptional regulator with XRE-family HTH domain
MKGVAKMGDLSFGQYIEQLRITRNMSQRKLAEKADLTNSTISRIEANLVKPDHATLEKLSNALEIEKSLLLTKCGYSEIPEEFVIIARKTGDLSEKKRKEIFDIFNNTIDDFLLNMDNDEED